MQGDHKDRLRTLNRPKQVGEFLAWHRQLDRHPHIRNIAQYGSLWTAWHEELKVLPGHQDMIKGGGNGVFLLILTLRWWMDYTDEMEAGEAKESSNNRLEGAVRELDESLAAIHGSGALTGDNEGTRSEEDVSETESRPTKRQVMCATSYQHFSTLTNQCNYRTKRDRVMAGKKYYKKRVRT